MASSSSSKDNINNGLLLFRAAEAPHFFKMFHAASLNQHKLEIPRKFVRFYGNHLPSHVMLKVPSGAKWEVEIVKSEGEIWLQNGWREFTEYYSISDGSLLVFEYEKSASEFNVIIFDKSTTEIDYPFCFKNGDNNSEDDQNQVNTNAQSEEQRVNKKALSRAEKAKAVQRAIANFQSDNPSFSIVMQPSYIEKTNVFVIPSSFARKYLDKNGDAVLNVLDGRSWSITYNSSMSSRGSTALTRICNSGWYKFVEDNDLQVGDVCIFELLLEHVDETIFRVTISKCSGNGKQPKLSSDCPKRPILPRTCNVSSEYHRRKKMKLENSVKTSNRDCPKGQVKGSKINFKARSSYPTFKVAMKSANFFKTNKYYLRVPSKFVEKMEKRSSHTVKLQVDDKLWSVKVNIYRNARLFSEGWVEFARQNKLKLGDVCTFELIDAEISMIRVSIARNV